MTTSSGDPIVVGGQGGNKMTDVGSADRNDGPGFFGTSVAFSHHTQMNNGGSPVKCDQVLNGFPSPLFPTAGSTWFIDCIEATDLFLHINSGSYYVGSSNGSSSFENTIQVY